MKNAPLLATGISAALIVGSLPFLVQSAPPVFKLPALPIVGKKPPSFLENSLDVRTLKGQEDGLLESQNIAQVFENVSMLTPLPGGGLGSYEPVAFPGSPTSGTLVLWEDLILNDPSAPDGSFDFSVLGSEIFESVEFFQGNDPILGASGIGGTIRLTSSLEKEERYPSNVRVEGGSNGLARLDGQHKICFKKGALKIAAHGLRTDGAPVGLIPTLRKRQAYDTMSLDLEGKFFIKDSTTLSFFLRGGESQLESLFNAQGISKSKNALGALAIATRNPSETTEHRLSLLKNVSVRTSFVYAKKEGIYKGDREEIRYSVKHKVSSELVVQGGGGIVQESFYQRWIPIKNIYECSKKRPYEYVFLSQTVKFLQNFRFTSGGRMEDNIQKSSPIFAGKTSLDYEHRNTLGALTFDYAEKRPTLYQLYVFDSYQEGNLSLKPEHAYGIQAFALEKNILPKTDIGLRVFDRWFSNVCVARKIGLKYRCESSPFFEVQGIEPSFSTKLTSHMKLKGDVVYAQLKKGNSSLSPKTLTPTWKASMGVFYSEKFSNGGTEESLSLYFKGRFLKYRVNAFGSKVSPFAVFDVGCDYGLDSQKTVYFQIKNIFNKFYRNQIYPDTRGEGVSFYGGVGFSF